MRPSNKHENHNKRPRRASESITSLSRTATVDGDGSEDELPASKTTKRGRPDAAQSARQAEQREKARAEAAGRRQERAGRRRGEGTSISAPNHLFGFTESH